MVEPGAARRQRVPQVERREAQRPTSLGACAPQRPPRVTRNGRGRTGGPIARAAQKGAVAQRPGATASRVYPTCALNMPDLG